MSMAPVGYGKFRMLTPARSMKSHIIVGAQVHTDGIITYTKRVKPSATRDDLRRAVCELREKIHKDHPGIKEEFTMLRPKTAYN